MLTSGFTLIARLRVKDGMEDDFEKAGKALVAWVKDNEPYVDSYNLYRDGQDAAFVDHYESDKAFMDHVASKAGAELLPAVLATTDIVGVHTFGSTSDEVAQALKGFGAQQFGVAMASAGR